MIKENGYTIVYVDDILIASRSINKIDTTANSLKEYFHFRDFGILKLLFRNRSKTRRKRILLHKSGQIYTEDFA